MAKIQNVLTVALLVVAVAAIITSIIEGSILNIMPIIGKTPRNPNGSFINGLFSVLAITPFFYAGFDTIPQGIEECSEGVSSKRLSRTILFSIIAACIFYIFILLAVSMTMPWQEIIGLSMPASDVYEIGLKLPVMGKLILVGALCGLITTLNSFFVAGARVLLTLGRAGFLNESFSRIHPVYKTPYFSNTIIAVITLIGPFVGKTLLLPIINICSLGFMIAWLMVCMSSIKLKNGSLDKLNRTGWDCIKYLSVGLSVLMIMILIIPSSPGALKWPIEWGIVAIWIIIGAVLYIASNSGKAKISDEDRKKWVLGEFYNNKNGDSY